MLQCLCPKVGTTMYKVMSAFYIKAVVKSSKTFLMCHIYSNEWPLQMLTRL